MAWQIILLEKADTATCRAAAFAGLTPYQKVAFLERVKNLDIDFPAFACRYAEDADWELYVWREAALPLLLAVAVDMRQSVMFVIGLFPPAVTAPLLDAAMTSFFAQPGITARVRRPLPMWHLNLSWKA